MSLYGHRLGYYLGHRLGIVGFPIASGADYLLHNGAFEKFGLVGKPLIWSFYQRR